MMKNTTFLFRQVCKKAAWCLLAFFAVGLLTTEVVEAAAITDLTIINNGQTQTTQDGGEVNIIGKFSTDMACTVQVSATIENSTKTHSYQIPAGSAADNVGWFLTWTRADVAGGNYGGPDQPIQVTATLSNCEDSNTDTKTADFNGTLEIGTEPLTPESIALVENIASMMEVRFAGNVYLPQGTAAGADQTMDYVYASTVDAYHQIWNKTLGDGNTYPFLVSFFANASDRGSIEHTVSTP